MVLVIGAIAAAVIGYRLSTESAESAAVQPAPAPVATPVVRAAASLRAGEVVKTSDLTVEQVTDRPAGSFSSPDQVVGQIPGTDVAAGVVLTRTHFQIESHLLRGLHPGERAVAIKVDEVTGLGGLAKPGDRVDVLLYLRGVKETADITSAQVVLEDVRVLAYGEAVQRGPAEEEPALPPKTEKVTGGGRSRSPSSAVLAVPEAAASKLMLAANSGNLRLSLRPLAAKSAESGADTATVPAVVSAPPPVAAAKTASSAAAAAAAPVPPHFVRLSDLVPEKKPVAAVGAQKKAAAAAQPRIMIYEGDTVRSVGRPPR